MTLARRLTAIESSLTPTQLVLRWLGEAHAYGSFATCARVLLDDDPGDVPLNRLCREAERTARATVGSRAREEVQRAVAKALRETVFRFLLVLRISVTTQELLEKEQLFNGLLAANLTALARAPHGERGEETHCKWLRLTVKLALVRVSELEAAAQARAAAEERYLDGCQALFPNAVGAWDAQVQATRELAATAIRLVELDELDLPPPEDDGELAERVAVHLADIVEWAKVTALEKLGEGEQGLRIAAGWLRPKLDASRADADWDSAGIA